MPESAEIHGTVAPGFEKVREAFEANFTREPDPMLAMLGDTGPAEVGAAVAVYHRGEKVVDLWGGEADRRTHRPYAEDTLQLVFSSTKGIVATAAHVLIDRGLLDPTRIRQMWDQFNRQSHQVLASHIWMLVVLENWLQKNMD